ncbi:MAG: glycine oxidase ThiO [Actinobacteria bacterium]|nr:glycine oxidase ThiO [Actinomycetota bacterium]
MDSRDVVVVGGGVIGLGVAWRCAQRGLTVTVVDDRPGRGASHAAAGMIAPVSEVTYGEETLLTLTMESARRWPGFAAELERASSHPIGHLREGSLAVALDADDNRALEALFRFQRSLGLDAERLTGSECRELEPALVPGVRGGVLVRGEQQVDNRATTAALLLACERAEVELVAARADEVRFVGDRVVGVAVGGEPIEAPVTVLAAGAWSGSLPGLPPGVLPPVRPVKGQILRLMSPGGGKDRLLQREVWGRVEGREAYLVPRASGEIVVGGTVEEQGFDTTVTVEGVRAMLTAAFTLVPGIDECELVEATAGLRPATPDNAPVLGPSALDGLVLATGHYRHGFLLLPVTADAVAEVVVSGQVPEEIRAFSIDRFTRAGAPA